MSGDLRDCDVACRSRLLFLIQGDSDLVSLLRQLITLAYVEYIKYTFNHLILYMGDFVWHIKCIHMWSVASGNYRILFLADFDFLTFLAHI